MTSSDYPIAEAYQSKAFVSFVEQYLHDHASYESSH